MSTKRDTQLHVDDVGEGPLALVSESQPDEREFMTSSPRTPSAIGQTLLCVLVAAAFLVSCGDGNGDESRTLSVAELVDASPGEATVEGPIVWDSDSARLCAVLMESYPAQCGGPSVVITNPDQVVADLDEAQGVRWTPSFATVSGHFDGDQFTIE